jgi:hypothetical protein
VNSSIRGFAPSEKRPAQAFFFVVDFMVGKRVTRTEC